MLLNFREIRFKRTYDALESEVISDLYQLLVNNSKTFDRIEHELSYKGLSRCLSKFSRFKEYSDCKYRILILKELSHDIFNFVQNGNHALSYVVDNFNADSINTLELEDRLNLSNLAYMVERGIVSIKIGLYREGSIVSLNSGYAEDFFGNNLCYTSIVSSSDTSKTDRKEYVELTTSWLSSSHDAERISYEKYVFQRYWTSASENMITIDFNEFYKKYLAEFNKGHLMNPLDDTTDRFVLDYTYSPVLRVPKITDSIDRLGYRLRLQNNIERIEDRNIHFKNSSKKILLKLFNELKSYCDVHKYLYEVTPSYRKMIESSPYLDDLSILGHSIKTRNIAHADTFNLFKKTVDSVCVRTLTDEQMWDAYLLYNLKRGANFSVPGSGKTATILGIFAYMHAIGSVNRIIMIGPLNSFDTWEYEFEAVFGDNIPLESMNTAELRSDSMPLEYHIRFNTGRKNLILLNYEIFGSNNTLEKAVSERIGNDTLLVFDEVHRIKNIHGKRAQKLVPLGKYSQNTIVMTGTPIPNDYTDIYNFLNILYPEHYSDFFKYTPSELSKLSNSEIDDINDKMRPFFCRTTKQKLGVPDANEDVVIQIDATPEENIVLDMIRNQIRNPLAIIIRILQLASDPEMLRNKLSGEDSSYFTEANLEDVESAIELSDNAKSITSKTLECIKLASELVSEGKKIIIWCIFIQSIRNIQKLLENKGISVCTVFGETEDKAHNLNLFRDGEVQVLITNPQTLAESVSLHRTCHDAIYFEYSYNLIHMLQSKDRIHRLGLPDDQYTQYYFLQTVFNMDDERISLDEEILTRLKDKEEVMLDAIESDRIEHYTTDVDEIEEIVKKLGIFKDPEN